MDLQVTSGAMATLREEAARAAPREACGLLLGRGVRVERAVPAANVHPDPLRHFEIDPAALIAAHRAARASEAEVVGYFHSHPNGHPRPSAADCEHASGDRRVWAIVTGGEAGDDVTFWRDGEDSFEALSYVEVEG